MTDPRDLSDTPAPDDIQERLAVLRAGVDQAKAAGEELAAMMVAYFVALRAQGMENEHAFQLTVGYQDWFLNQLVPGMPEFEASNDGDDEE